MAVTEAAYDQRSVVIQKHNDMENIRGLAPSFI